MLLHVLILILCILCISSSLTPPQTKRKKFFPHFSSLQLPCEHTWTLHTKHPSLSVSFFHTQTRLADSQEETATLLGALRPCGSPHLTFYMWVITALISWHSACESYEIWNTSWKLWLQTSGPGGLSQTANTNFMKNKTCNPYLQWNLSRALPHWVTNGQGDIFIKIRVIAK